MNRKSGFSLLELALSLSVMAALSLPLIRLLNGLQAQQKEQQIIANKANTLKAIEGFILTHHRLPCPAQSSAGVETWQNNQCEVNSGWVPARTLGMRPGPSSLRMAVATLESVGPPIHNVLLRPHPLRTISLEDLTALIEAPPQTQDINSGSALPALHICIQVPGKTPPPTTVRGCGEMPTQSYNAVLVVYPGNVPARSNQFFIDPHQPARNPAWISYEQLVWLWMQSNQLNQISVSP